MNRYHFLLTRRWVLLGLLLIIAASACVRLGIWQHDRHEYKVELSAQIQEHYDATPLPLAADLAAPEAANPPEWQTIEITGNYIGEPVVAPHRPVAGSPADHALGIFQDSVTGQYIALNRGWFPTDVFNDPADIIAFPAGTQTLIGHVRTSEPIYSTNVDPGQVRSMNPGRIWQEATNDRPVPAELIESFYLQIGEEFSGLEPQLHGHDRPDTGLGNHFSYALQWWTFALGCILGYVILARREAADADATVGPTPLTGEHGSDSESGASTNSAQVAATELGKKTESKRRRRKKLGTQDADDEDSLIDAQLEATQSE